MPFSQIIPPSPSPTESKRLFCTSVSLWLSHIQGYHYYLSKFHIYVLVYCIGENAYLNTIIATDSCSMFIKSSQSSDLSNCLKFLLAVG